MRGPATISALTVTKPLDKASATLFQGAVQGNPFATATFEVFGPVPPMVATTYDLTTVLISSLTQGSPSRCVTAVPTEDVALSFGTIMVSSSP